MLDEYGRTIINIVITDEDKSTEPTLCVRYTEEKVNSKVCHQYAGNNCKRCPIHLNRVKLGTSDNNILVLREYCYDLDTEGDSKRSGLSEFIKAIFHKRS